jgi:membrane protein DedA with SNARE-associated domain
MTGMRWQRFLIFNAIGAALWVGLWTTVGYVSGSHIDTIYADVTRYSTYLLAVLAVLLVAYVARRVMRHRRAQSSGPAT